MKVNGRDLAPYGDRVVAHMVDDFGLERTRGGVIVDKRPEAGNSFRARWFKILGVGPDQEDVSPGQWALVAHGGWTRRSRGFTAEDGGREVQAQMVDPEEILGVQEEEPEILERV